MSTDAEKKTLKLFVRSNLPAKTVSTEVACGGSVEDVKTAAAKALAIDLKEYTYSVIGYGIDVVGWSDRKDNDKHGLSDGQTLVVYAPSHMMPKPRRKEKEEKEAADDSDEDKFKGFTEENVWKKLESKGPKEAKIALEYFLMNGETLLEKKEWINLPHDLVAKIISNDTLSVESEVQVFTAVTRWGEAELKRKKEEKSTKALQAVLTKLLPHVRFPLMTTEHVASKVVPAALLTSEQTLELFTYLAQVKGGLDAKLGKSISTFKTTQREGSGGSNCWNPDDRPDPRIELSNNNLTTSTSTSGFNANVGVRAKHGWTSGKHYWEIQVQHYDGGGNGYNSAGVCLKSAPLTASHGYPLEAATGEAWVIGMYICQISTGTSHSMTSYGSHRAIASGDRIGFYLDLTVGTLVVYHNGTLVGTAFSGLKGKGKLYPCVSMGRLNRNVYVADFKAKPPF